MNSRLTLYELNLRIRDSLQEAFPGPVWVVAEISEMKVNRSGHCYLELIEKEESTDEIRARAKAIIWSYSFRMLKPWFETTTGQPFTEGIRILAEANVEYHPAYGLSLSIRDMDPAYTMGDLALRRREVLRQLEEAGVLTMNRELPLPLVPQRIAVISSATAAGYGDFVKQLEENPYGFRFGHTLFEAWMQGAEAVSSIVQALDRIYRKEKEFDAVAIIRGGGAQADLTCFDHFDLANAVAQFPLPVITGIGHEKDETITDLVAHTRQKTPTAVAGFFISGMLRFRDLLNDLSGRLSNAGHEIMGALQVQLVDTTRRAALISGERLSRSLSQLTRQGGRLRYGITGLLYGQREFLNRFRYRLPGSVALLLRREEGRLLRRAGALRYAALQPLDRAARQLGQLTGSLKTGCRKKIFLASRTSENHEALLRLLNPLNILNRGFTLTLQEGKILKSSKKITPGALLESRFSDGSVFSTPITGNHDHEKIQLPGGDQRD